MVDAMEYPDENDQKRFKIVIFVEGRKMYAIVDIETTGGGSKTDKITEIAAYLHDGEKVVDEFVTLIHPERSIPHYITELTGINNDMVAQAPKFYEVAKDLVEFTNGAVFVAHNVMFDYNFIKQEFKSLGYDFQRERLCTVRLSRKAFPGLRSYGLGNLCKHFGIPNEARHRAAGDARATVTLFEKILDVGEGELIHQSLHQGISKADLSPHLDPSVLHQLPEATGVYYFYDLEGNLIYIGKSKDIKKRVYSHLRNHRSAKGDKMRKQIASIDYELTGSELIALLKESDEIKQHKPIFNRAQRRTIFNHGIVAEYDLFGYTRIIATRPKKNQEVIASCGTAAEARELLYRLSRDFELCHKMLGLEKVADGKPCFNHQLKQCRGACVGEEAPEEYNERAAEAIQYLHFPDKNFILIDEGRSPDEKSVVVVKNGQYRGFGYFDVADQVNSPEELMDCIKIYQDNRDVRSIIKGYMNKASQLKVIKF